MEQRKTLGVIGGLGPIATAHFMELVIRMTDAESDQEHLDMMIFNFPSTPDRTSYILDHTKENPLPKMAETGRRLAAQGADYIAIPCITAHYFHEALAAAIPCPIIHIVRETVAHLKAHGITRAGVMATDGTVTAGLFQQELLRSGITPVIPSPERQRDVMALIYDDIKANRPAEMNRFERVSHELRDGGAQAVILGCTELSLIKRDHPIGSGFIDAMEVLAQRAVVLCGAALKPEYRELITR